MSECALLNFGRRVHFKCNCIPFYWTVLPKYLLSQRFQIPSRNNPTMIQLQALFLNVKVVAVARLREKQRIPGSERYTSRVNSLGLMPQAN